MKKHLVFLIFFIWVQLGYSQSNIPIGSWKSHLPYQSGIWLTQSQEKVIYATPWSLFVIDKDEMSYDFITKVEGLSDVGISLVDYDEKTDQIIIIYSNGNIDLYSNEGVINLPNILTNQNISGDKNIYGIHTDNGFTYLATGFGLVQIDLNKVEFGFTTFTGVRVNDVVNTDNKIYIGTEDGSYVASINDNVNLGDFTNWNFLGDEFGLPIVYGSRSVATFGGKVFLEVDNRLFFGEEGGVFTEIFVPESGYEIAYLSSEGQHLVIGTRDNGSTSNIYLLDIDFNLSSPSTDCVNRTLYAIEDQSGSVWYADEWSGFRMVSNDGECRRLEIDSPRSHTLSNISIKDNEVFVASGGASDVFNYTFTRNGVYILSEGSWNNVNENNVSIIKENDLLNFYDILPHPSENKVYLGTYWGGIVEWNRDTDGYTYFDMNNSSLQGAIGDEQRERVAGMAFDQGENLWVSNYGTGRPLSVYTQGGEWYNYDTDGESTLTEIAVDGNNYKWVAAHGNAGGVLVYDDNGTVDNANDDRQRFINSNNSELTTNRVNTVAVDLDGSVWVGSTEGVVLFECGTESFESECVGRRIKVLQDSIAAFLLADVEITDIEIDGANRKWFASKNGIFVQSADGQIQELRFTAENSPLFDNNIIDLAYDGSTGDMYIGTDKGLQVYRTATTEAFAVHSNVYTYPNPVPPEYTGPIAIKGLAQDADVKITDLNGKLVYETTALGGLATWDGNLNDGGRAHTGVYLVFSVSDNAFFDIDSYVAKILLVR